MKKQLTAILLGAAFSVIGANANVTFSGTSLTSSVGSGNPLSLTAGQVGIYINNDNATNWLSFNGTGKISSGLSLFNSATFTPVGTSDSYTYLGNASVTGTSTLALSGGAFSPLTFTGNVGQGDQWGVIVFNTSTTTTQAGDTYNVWRASDWTMPVDGSTLTFSTAPSAGSSIQRITASSYLVASGTVVGAVPEPSTYALLAVGAVGLLLSFRRRKVQA
jgi:hypothetical protein